MSAQETIALVRTAIDLYNAHNSDPEWLSKSLDLVTDDCEIIEAPRGMAESGKNGFRQFLLLWSTSFPDSSVEIIDLFATEERASVEFIGRGTNSGALHTSAGDIAPTYRKMELLFCQTYRISNGKISGISTYYDALSMLQQLGLIRPAGAPTVA